MRAVAAVAAAALALALAAAAAATAAPIPNSFTTTATTTNLGQQACTAASRTNTGIRPKKTKLAVKAPLHPGGGEGAGGKRG